jgi:hypothetical protein
LQIITTRQVTGLIGEINQPLFASGGGDFPEKTILTQQHYYNTIKQLQYINWKKQYETI